MLTTMTHPTDALHIPDTQSERDERHLAIQRVGIKDVRYPLQLRVAGAVQATAALWDLDVALPAEKKGTHMSRFVAWLDWRSTRRWTPPLLRERLAAMLERWVRPKAASRRAFRSSCASARRSRACRACSTTRAAGSPRRAPASRRSGPRSAVPVKSLCPCSKEISDYGAHNQRSTVTIRVEIQAAGRVARTGALRRRQRLERGLGRCSSAPTRSGSPSAPTKTRSSSKTWCATWRCALNADARIGRYCVEVENFESIHNHAAYARIERA